MPKNTSNHGLRGGIERGERGRDRQTERQTETERGERTRQAKDTGG